MADDRPRTPRGKLVDQALRALDDADAELGSLVALHRTMLAETQRLSQLAAQLSRAIADAEAEPGNTKARQQLAELTANLSLMQLQIGQKIDEQSRQFTLITNVMKTRHDTAKNAIGNIR
jgi:hypothetical protein